MSTLNETTALQVTRLIKATPECAFAAWTTPDQIKNWFGPGASRVSDAQIDLQPGGKYRFRAFNEQGAEMTVHGEYREVSRSSKLVFTWQWEDDPDWDNVTSVVTVDFIKRDGGTEVRITQEGFPSSESSDRHEEGWNGSLDKLAARTAVIAEMFGPGHFSWNELLAADVESAAAFYTKLLGWETVPFTGGDIPYTLFRKNGTEVGGLMKMPMEGVPPHWLSYITVEAVDATAQRVMELGGTVCAPPFDVPSVGRLAVLQDPQGARFGIFQPLK